MKLHNISDIYFRNVCTDKLLNTNLTIIYYGQMDIDVIILKFKCKFIIY